MKSTRILDSEISGLRISSLTSRPTSPRESGGDGMNARELKSAFDRLPLFIIERYNRLIGDIESCGADSLAGAMPTGIKDGHTLYGLICDITSGELSSYLSLCGESLTVKYMHLLEELAELKDRVDALEEVGGK